MAATSTTATQAACCAVSGVADGRTTAFACNVAFRRFASHPRSGEPFGGHTIVGFPAVVSLAKAAHDRLAYFDVLSCDIAITTDGQPCLIEVNTSARASSRISS